ncbi:hypothetical protein PR048_005032 [Dryococelus australis]|uniref:Uncharacterized protein n=1 Tax=Dryococelus australis TaxID=614101 RepID=A0ABQ9I733_9NEOP|nr:hypothetical protein PR048_005032 [Dryococelus australis]
MSDIATIMYPLHGGSSTEFHESKLNTMTTDDTLEETDYLATSKGGFNLYPMHDSLRLLDAHLIFEPLLSCLGVMPQQMISKLSGVSSDACPQIPGEGNFISFRFTELGGYKLKRFRQDKLQTEVVARGSRGQLIVINILGRDKLVQGSAVGVEHPFHKIAEGSRASSRGDKIMSTPPRQEISHGSNNTSSFDTWGSNLSLVGGIETMRIDIVVSEHGRFVDKKKGKTGGAAAAAATVNKNMKNLDVASFLTGDKFYLDIPQETPAFLCEKMSVELDLKKMADMTVDEMIQKQNMLYISRGQLKKHTSSDHVYLLGVGEIPSWGFDPFQSLLQGQRTLVEVVVKVLQLSTGGS